MVRLPLHFSLHSFPIGMPWCTTFRHEPKKARLSLWSGQREEEDSWLALIRNVTDRPQHQNLKWKKLHTSFTQSVPLIA